MIRCVGHLFGEVLLFDRLGEETSDPRQADFASARCDRCGRLAVDAVDVDRRGQVDVIAALERAAS